MPLATDKALYQSDGVAVVVGESRGAAMDGAEVVDVDYAPLDAVTDAGRDEARARSSTTASGTNEAHVVLERPRRRGVPNAPVIVRERYRIQRRSRTRSGPASW